MSSVNIDLAADTILNVMVGQQDENEVREVVFDFSDWYTTYGSGTISLAIQRPKDEWPYEGTLTVDNSTHKATWEISDTDSAYAGVGQIQLSYTVGTARKKSVVYRFTVYKSLGALGNVITPIQIQTFIDEVTEALEDMQEELNDVKQELQEIIDGGGGSGMTEEFKQALHNILQQLVYISADGQTYLDALDNAMWPPANLASISCVYTQSGAVYATDSLDSLKSDLVVTAHYSNGTTQTVTSYALSGTLAVGTSTITVSYGGKTATFTVTVSEQGALYPLPNGTFSLDSGSVTISNGNHIKIEYPDAVSQSNLFINFKDQLHAAVATYILNNRPEWFVIPSGKEVIFDISNVTNDTGLTWQMNFRKSNTTTSSSFGTGNLTTSGATVTHTLSADESVSCVFLYATSHAIPAGASLEFDISLTVDGVRYI